MKRRAAERREIRDTTSAETRSRVACFAAFDILPLTSGSARRRIFGIITRNESSEAIATKSPMIGNDCR